MPRTTGFGTSRASASISPVSVSTSIVTPIASPPPKMTRPGSFWAITSAAKAFRGCTGIGMPYQIPEKTCISPNITSTPAGSIPDAAITPISSGKSVPRSPNAPASSLRLKVSFCVLGVTGGS
jgi:hypothetical protein